MKRFIAKIFTIAACAAMMLTVASVSNVQSVQADTLSQGTVNLATKKLIISKGVKTTMINNTLTMVKGRRYQVKAKFGTTMVTAKGIWMSSKPSIVSAYNTGLIIANKPGTSTIKVTYNGKVQSFKVKVITSHTHAWKTIRKATTCDTDDESDKGKGTKLCKKCGVTKSFNLAHEYITKTSDIFEHKGKPYSVTTAVCGGCGADMTFWTKEQKEEHRYDLGNFQCLNASISGVDGFDMYPQYFMVRHKEIYCKHCGAWKSHITTDLYECNSIGYEITPGTDPTEWSHYKNYCKEHLTFKIFCSEKHNDTQDTANAAVSTMPVSNIVLAETENASEIEVIVDGTEDTKTVIISGNEIISENEIVIEK